MSDQSVPVVTLSMFWPLLMWAAGNDNAVAHAALDRVQARTGFASDPIYQEDVAEEIAREHFPSGATGVGIAFYCGNSDGWADDREGFESFKELLDGIDEHGPLSHTDPAHVAMVVRILAISQSLPVYAEGPNVRFKHEEHHGMWVSLWRTRPARSSGEATSVGHFFPYQPGENAENFDAGAAVFRWMIERHAEIVKATCPRTLVGEVHALKATHSTTWLDGLPPEDARSQTAPGPGLTEMTDPDLGVLSETGNIQSGSLWAAVAWIDTGGHTNLGYGPDVGLASPSADSPCTT